MTGPSGRVDGDAAPPGSGALMTPVSVLDAREGWGTQSCEMVKVAGVRAPWSAALGDQRKTILRESTKLTPMPAIDPAATASTGCSAQMATNVIRMM